MNKFPKQLLLSRQGKGCSQLTFCPAPKNLLTPKSAQISRFHPSHPMKGFLPGQHLPGCFHSARHQNLSTPNSTFISPHLQLWKLLEGGEHMIVACSHLTWLPISIRPQMPNLVSKSGLKIWSINLVSKSGPKTWSLNLVSKSDLNLVCSQLAFYANTKNLLTCFHQPPPFERVACEWFPVRAAFVGGRN